LQFSNLQQTRGRPAEISMLIIAIIAVCRVVDSAVPQIEIQENLLIFVGDWAEFPLFLLRYIPLSFYKRSFDNKFDRSTAVQRSRLSVVPPIKIQEIYRLWLEIGLKVLYLCHHTTVILQMIF